MSEQWPIMLGLAYPELQGLSLCDMILKVVHRAFQNRSHGDPEALGPHGFNGLMDFIEFCAGSANLSKQLILRGYRGCSFDVLYSGDHDMMSAQGLRLYIDAIVSCVTNSLQWWGTKCSSFVQICSSVTRRSEENGWLGDYSRQCVVDGNIQCEVTSLGIFLGILTGALPLLEQPMTSCMPKTSSLNSIFQFFQFTRTGTYMGSFEGSTVKPLQLWHLPQTFEGMARVRPDPALFSETLASRSANGAYTGKKDLLVNSEFYTPAFGKAVCEIFGHLRAN